MKNHSKKKKCSLPLPMSFLLHETDFCSKSSFLVSEFEISQNFYLVPKIIFSLEMFV